MSMSMIKYTRIGFMIILISLATGINFYNYITNSTSKCRTDGDTGGSSSMQYRTLWPRLAAGNFYRYFFYVSFFVYN